jgi:DNA-binding FrmR family transcriptional regulator
VVADKKTMEKLLKTARGQLDGLLRMVEEDRYCIDISNQLLAAQAVLRRANREVLLAHLRGCVQDSFKKGSAEDREEKLQEVVDIFDKLTK